VFGSKWWLNDGGWCCDWLNGVLCVTPWLSSHARPGFVAMVS